MYVGGLGMGLTVDDLSSMPADRLMWLIHVNNLLHGGEEEAARQEGRPGTIEELKRIL